MLLKLLIFFGLGVFSTTQYQNDIIVEMISESENSW